MIHLFVPIQPTSATDRQTDSERHQMDKRTEWLYNNIPRLSALPARSKKTTCFVEKCGWPVSGEHDLTDLTEMLFYMNHYSSAGVGVRNKRHKIHARTIKINTTRTTARGERNKMVQFFVAQCIFDAMLAARSNILCAVSFVLPVRILRDGLLFVRA